MARIEPRKRPHYPAQERLAILLLRSARDWSLEQTARNFLVTKATIAYWNRRLREGGSDELIKMPEPANKFPDFVRYSVQRLKALWPSLGKVKIADILCRAGLHLAASTVGRIIKEEPVPPPTGEIVAPAEESTRSTAKVVVTADRPNHVWHVDLTAVPILPGFWAPWLPNAFPQCWPFCWWVGVVIDHFSRRAMGFYVWRRRPTTKAVQAFLNCTFHEAGTTPKYLISDKGIPFWCADYKAWCLDHGIEPRFGAVGQHGSIAVVKRFIRTLKESGLRQIVVPFRRQDLRDHISWFMFWYNVFRPHMTLEGKTPNEVYHARPPANEQPRIEPRSRWPVTAACAKPHVTVDGAPGTVFQLQLAHHGKQRHLPIVTLRRAA
jgi:transposase InsO family protein